MNEYKCTDNHVIIEYPFETRQCLLVNKFKADLKNSNTRTSSNPTTATTTSSSTATTTSSTTATTTPSTSKSYAEALKSENTETLEHEKEDIKNEQNWAKTAIEVGTYEGKIKEFSCIDLTKTLVSYFTNATSISLEPVAKDVCAVYRL